MPIFVIANFLLMIVPIFILYRMFKDNFYSVIPIIIPFIGVFSIGISVAYLEIGVYSPELFLTTSQTGGTIRYVFAINAFLLAYWFFFRLIVSKNWIAYQKKMLIKKGDNERINKFIVIIGMGTAILLLSYVPSEVIDSRNLFIAENPSIVRDFIFKYLPFVGLYLGLAAGLTKSNSTRAASYTGAILILFALFGFGHKFSTLISFIGNFAISFFVLVKFIPMRRPVFKIEFRAQFIFAIIAMLFVFTAGIIRYINIGELDATEYLTNRIFILQGGIWWFTDYEAFYGLHHPGIEGFLDFVKSIDYDQNLSLIYLMTKAIGTDLTYKIVFIHYGLYTGAFPAIFYEIGGLTGPVLFSFLSGIVIAVVSGYLVRKLIKRQFILILVSFNIYLLVIAIMAGGEFTHIFSIKIVIKFLVLFFLEFIFYMVKNDRNITQLVLTNSLRTN